MSVIAGMFFPNLFLSASINLATESTFGVLIIVSAIIAMLVGALIALKQKDLMSLIYAVAAAEIGFVFLAIGTALLLTGTVYGSVALDAGIFHAINTAIGFVLLLQVAISIHHSTKENDISNLGELAKKMKYTCIFFIFGFLALIGIPPTSSFASSLIIYESAYRVNPVLSVIAILCSILLLAAFVKALYFIFLKPSKTDIKDVKEVPKSMLLSMGIIAAIITIFSILPSFVLEFIVQPTVDSILNHPNYFKQASLLIGKETSVYWDPIIFVIISALALLIVYVIRGFGNDKYNKKSGQTKPVTSGEKNYKQEDVDITHTDIYQVFFDSTKWAYALLEKKIGKRKVSDYILILTVLIPALLFIVGVI